MNQDCAPVQCTVQYSAVYSTVKCTVQLAQVELINILTILDHEPGLCSSTVYSTIQCSVQYSKVYSTAGAGGTNQHPYDTGWQIWTRTVLQYSIQYSAVQCTSTIQYSVHYIFGQFWTPDGHFGTG